MKTHSRTSLPALQTSESKHATHSNNETKSLPTSFLPVRELESVVSDFADAKEFVGSKSSLLKNPSTFFEFRLSAKKLLQHAAYGEKDKVQATLKQNPLLLLEKGTVVDYSGRTHEGRTVYQIVLGAVDRDVIIQKDAKNIKVVDGMVEMVEGYFSRLPFPPEERERIKKAQYDGQFPPGQKEIEETRANNESLALITVVSVIEASSDADCQATNELEDKIHHIIRKEKDAKRNSTQRAINLKKLTQAIIKAGTQEKFESAFQQLKVYLQATGFIQNPSFNFTILKAIYQFRNHLEPKAAMTSGRHFNHQLLNEAAELYDANYIGFGANMPDEPWNAPKNVMCLQKVFGYAERFVPACDGQVIAQGPYSILEYGDKSDRSLSFAYGGGTFFPLDSDPDWELGYNCSFAWRGPVGRGIPRGWARISNLMSNKNNRRARNSMQRADSQTMNSVRVFP